jgi:hypothetical protein
MHAFVTSPTLAKVISHQVLRESQGPVTSQPPRHPGRAERRAARRAALAAHTPQPRHRLARVLRPAH